MTVKSVTQNSISSLGRCEYCQILTHSLESHHLKPLCYGGKKSGAQVIICANCHTEIHKCIENPGRNIPEHLMYAVSVGRRIKLRYEKGQTVALDRRPSVAILLNEQDEKILEHVARLLNTKSKAETLLKALRYTALHATEQVRRRESN